MRGIGERIRWVCVWIAAPLVGLGCEYVGDENLLDPAEQACALVCHCRDGHEFSAGQCIVKDDADPESGGSTVVDPT